MTTSITAPAPVRCDGGSYDCLHVVTDPTHAEAALDGDLSAFPYCPPCRVAAHADSVLDDPEQGPRPLAPNPAEAEADLLFDGARRRDPGGHPTWWATQIEMTLRRYAEIELGALPTGGGSRRDDVGRRLVEIGETLRAVTRRMSEGTADVVLYDHGDDDAPF